MNTRTDYPNRRSIRLPGYDYSSDGWYFITICVQNRLSLFGNILNGEMYLNDAGKMVDQWWRQIGTKFPNTQIGAHCVMPNHFHGLISLQGISGKHVGLPLRGITGEHIGSPLRGMTGEHIGSPLRGMTGTHTGVPLREREQQSGSPNPTLSRVIQWMKTMTTNAYICAVKEEKWTPFSGRLWQRNYHEHIVRNEVDLACIHEYIVMNPCLWSDDDLNPEQSPPANEE